MKYLFTLLLTASSFAQMNGDGCYHDTLYHRNYAREAAINGYSYEVERQQATPTAYSTMMQHYYDSVWQDRSQPQVIVIER